MSEVRVFSEQVSEGAKSIRGDALPIRLFIEEFEEEGLVMGRKAVMEKEMMAGLVERNR